MISLRSAAHARLRKVDCNACSQKLRAEHVLVALHNSSLSQRAGYMSGTTLQHQRVSRFRHNGRTGKHVKQIAFRWRQCT